MNPPNTKRDEAIREASDNSIKYRDLIDDNAFQACTVAFQEGAHFAIEKYVTPAEALIEELNNKLGVALSTLEMISINMNPILHTNDNLSSYCREILNQIKGTGKREGLG